MKRTVGKKRRRNRMLLLVMSGLVLLTVLTGFLIFSSFYVEMELNGDVKVTLEYGDTYEEEGAQAFLRSRLFKSKRPLKVTTEGNVDTTRLGSNEIAYHANSLTFSATRKRTVEVCDTQAPVLTLNTEENHFTVKGEAYEEEGFTASDTCDGDLTDKVEHYEEDGVVYYSVTDASGNTATATRTIRYQDSDPPVLTLAGEPEISIQAGEAYTEPGWTAVDEVDGDLNGKVEVSGCVDSYRAGTYTLQYSVKDQFGNTATAQRTVVVHPIRQADTVNPGSKIIYLTFDDGPGPYTQQLLDVLAKYNVKATFFTTSTKPDYLYMLTKEAEAGHTVAIHTASHNYAKVYADEQAYFEDLRQQSAVIEQKTGKKSMLLRFPGGGSNQVSRRYCPGIMSKLVQAVQDQGYKYFDWNVSSGDAGQTKDTEQVFQNVIAGVQRNDVSIVLQHDIHSYSVNAVEKIIIWGLENGYTFLPLDESSPAVHHGVAN